MDPSTPEALCIPELLDIVFSYCRESRVAWVCRLWREVFRRSHCITSFSYELLFAPRHPGCIDVCAEYMGRVRSGQGCRLRICNAYNTSTFIRVGRSRVDSLRAVLRHHCGVDVPIDDILGCSFTTLVFHPTCTEVHVQQIDDAGRSYDFRPEVSTSNRLHFLIDVADYLEVCRRFVPMGQCGRSMQLPRDRSLWRRAEVRWPNHPSWVLRGVLVIVQRVLCNIRMPHEMLFVEEADRSHPFIRSAPHCVGRVYDFHDDCYSELVRLPQPSSPPNHHAAIS